MNGLADHTGGKGWAIKAELLSQGNQELKTYLVLGSHFKIGSLLDKKGRIEVSTQKVNKSCES